MHIYYSPGKCSASQLQNAKKKKKKRLLILFLQNASLTYLK